MRSLVVLETALNMYFMDGHIYQYMTRVLDVPLDMVKSWCLRYRRKMRFHDAPKAHRTPFDI